jgi:hypothetical protein
MRDTATVEAESFLGSIMTTSAYDGMVNSIIDQNIGIKSEGINTRLISEGTQGAISQDQINSVIIHVGKTYQKSIDNLISATGADPHTAYDWMRANKPSELKLAMQNLFHAKDTSGFKALAKQFKTSSSNVVNTADRAKLGDNITQVNGVETVTVHGMQMSLTTAKRLGLI